MKEEYITYRSADGRTDISAKFWLPEQEPLAVLQIAHGMVEYKERYDGFAKWLTERGIAVCANDHLGHGDSVVSTERWGYVTKKNPSGVFVEDMNELRKTAQERFADVPYIILGHSMGSYVLRKYLGIYGEGLAGAIIMGTGQMPPAVGKIAIALVNCLAFFRGWKHRSRFIQNLTYDKYYKKYDLTGRDTSNSWLTKDPEIVRKYYSDPKCTYLFTLTGHKALFEAVSVSADDKAAEKIPADLPMLLVSGAMDPVGAEGEGVRKVNEQLERTGHTAVTMKLFENDRHEILNETNREDVYAYIYGWIMEKCLKKAVSAE